jgi:alpha-1,3-mannosyltransferase
MDLAQESISAGLRVTVLCFNRVKGVDGILPSSEAVGRLAIERVSFLDLTYYKPTVIPLSVLRSHSLIHVHGIGAPLDYVALMKWAHKKPIVLSTHGGIFHTTAVTAVKRLYFYQFLPWVMRQVDVVAACSRNDASIFNLVSDRVQLVENAIALKPHLDLSMDHKQKGRCLFVGRLSDNKRIDLLLSAASAARGRGAKFCLRVVGPDVEGKRRQYEDLAITLGLGDHVTFVGNIASDMLLKEYELAEVFVSASQYEGFGIAAIEAKAAGCRLLLQGNEAFGSLFESDGSALLVDFKNPGLAGMAFANLINQPSDVDLQESRWQAERYSWDRKLAVWLRIYRDLVPC